MPDDCDVIAVSAQLVPPSRIAQLFSGPVVPPGVLSLWTQDASSDGRVIFSLAKLMR